MLEVLKDKKYIFFDVGYTLDYPASGDWMFTKKFYEIVGDRLNKHSAEEIQKAREFGLEYLEKNHLVKNTEACLPLQLRVFPVGIKTGILLMRTETLLILILRI